MIRCGIDIVEIRRLTGARRKPGFEERIYSCREREEFLHKGSRPEYFAGRWAAKEAVAKALGCGFGEKCSPSEIEILSGPLGEPELYLSGAAAQRARELGVLSWSISLTHEKHYAAAMAVAEINLPVGKER